MINKFAIFDLGGSSIKYSTDDLKTLQVVSMLKVTDEKTLTGLYENNFDAKYMENLKNVKEDVLKFIAKIANDNGSETICISSPGIIDTKTGNISGLAAIDNWNSYNIYEELLALLKNKNTKIFIDNDGNCALLGNIYNYGKKINSAISIVIGTGIGGAYYNGCIQSGASNSIGEFGMMRLIGNKSESVSTQLSINALCNRVNQVLKTNYNGLEIFEQYEKNDEQLVKIVNQWFLELATFIYNIIWCFDPNVIFIGGAISDNKIFHSHLIENIDNLFIEVNAKRFAQIEFSKGGNIVNLLGAKLLSQANQ